MATKKQKKQAHKVAKKVAKKKPILFVVILLLLAAIGLTVFILYRSGIFEKSNSNVNPGSNTTPVQTNINNKPISTHTASIPAINTNVTNSNPTNNELDELIVENIIYPDFQIHFLELGSTDAGDSVYIKAGDNDILIDAGSVQSSAKTIETYIDNYCTDGKLEYVISTHAHKDHIAGMLGNTSKNLNTYKNKKGEAVSFENKDGDLVSSNGIFSFYDIDTIIDFGNRTNSNIDLVKNYKCALNYAISKGTKHYSAEECFNNSNGAKRSYELGDDISFDIMYNYYYFNESSAENDYSVCTMFNYKDQHFMFTGDLEESGEAKLVSYYNGSTPEKTLPHCVLFKGGHHGSPTSSNLVLLSKITPEICCVCCCAGTSQYTNIVNNQFPSQAFIDRIAKYTSRVYVTSTIDSSKNLISLNGNILISSNGIKVAIKCSNNNIKLKDSAWFNEEIYVLKDSKGYEINCNSTGGAWYDAQTAGAYLRKRRVWPSYGKE